MVKIPARRIVPATQDHSLGVSLPAEALEASLPAPRLPIYCKIVSPAAIVMKMTNVVPITVAI